jgi:hypothetical protein
MARRRGKAGRARRSIGTSQVERSTDRDTCYVCGRRIAPDERIRLFHELTVHDVCYERHLRP